MTEHDTEWAGGDRVSIGDAAMLEVGVGYISGCTFRLREVEYLVIHGLAVFEGDIVLGTAEELAATLETRRTRGGQVVRRPSRLALERAFAAPEFSVAGVGVSERERLWPAGKIPYAIDANLPSRHRVTDAIAHWEERAPLRFRPSEPEDVSYVYFAPGLGCSSELGRQPRWQTLTVGPKCTTGQVIHEIGHAVGLWHEHGRADRDQFVEIVWENVPTNHESQFKQRLAETRDLGPYDYRSIMHYGATAFSPDGDVTIEAPVEIGQREGLSDGDVAAVETLYA